MPQRDVQHDENRNDGFGSLGWQNEHHDVGNNNGNDVVDPLFSNGELEEEGAQDEGEQVSQFSVGEGGHDETEGVAEEHSEGVA